MSEPTTEDLAADIADIRRCLYQLHLQPATMSVEGLLRGYDNTARELEKTQREMRALRVALDELWGQLPTELVDQLESGTLAFCQANHELLWHPRRDA